MRAIRIRSAVRILAHLPAGDPVDQQVLAASLHIHFARVIEREPQVEALRLACHQVQHQHIVRCAGVEGAGDRVSGKLDARGGQAGGQIERAIDLLCLRAICVFDREVAEQLIAIGPVFGLNVLGEVGIGRFVFAFGLKRSDLFQMLEAIVGHHALRSAGPDRLFVEQDAFFGEAAEGGRSEPAVADRMACIPIGGRCIVADVVPACFICQGNTRQQQ